MFQFLGGLFASGTLVYITSAIKKGINTHLKLQRRENIAVAIDSLPPATRNFENMNASFSLMVLRKGVYKHAVDFKDLLKDIPHIDTTNYYNALPTLRVLIDFRGRFPKGEYFIDENMIAVSPKDECSTTLYSLMKVSATRKCGDSYAEGFARYKADDRENGIGIGLTDAYFDILFDRYFSPLVGEHTFEYPNELAALSIESIIGHEKMEELFFSCSLDGLVKSLSEFIPKERVISLIRKIDHINTISKSKNVVAKILTKKTYREIVEELIALLTSKSSKEREPVDEETIAGLLESEFKYSYVTYKTSKKEREKLLELTKRNYQI